MLDLSVKDLPQYIVQMRSLSTKWSSYLAKMFSNDIPKMQITFTNFQHKFHSLQKMLFVHQYNATNTFKIQNTLFHSCTFKPFSSTNHFTSSTLPPHAASWSRVQPDCRFVQCRDRIQINIIGWLNISQSFGVLLHQCPRCEWDSPHP